MGGFSNTPPRRRSSGRRLCYPDAVRGVAVILMLLWHTASGWLRPELHHGAPWRALRLLAGLGSAAFFVMLGAGIQLREEKLRRQGYAAHSIARQLALRGVELIIFGYLLRLQFFVIDSNGLFEPGGALVSAALLAGYCGILVALGPACSARLRPPIIAAAGGLFAIAFAGLDSLSHHALHQLFRVDVLQSLGMAMIVAGALRALIPPLRTAAGGAIGCALSALSTFPTADAFDEPPSPLLSHYLVRVPHDLRRWRRARFPLLPWLSLVLAGGAMTAWLHPRGVRGERPRWRAVVLGGIGALLVLATSEQLSLFELLLSAPRPSWLIQPMRMAMRVGAVGLLVAASYAVEERWIERIGPLLVFGRYSLMVYWLHLELAFGKPGGAVNGELGVAGWLMLISLMAGALYAVARLRQQYGRVVRRYLLDAAPLVRPVG